ncbi:MAG: hypothetical protein DSY93_10770, partial [SAR324 cluster bacterium]
IKFLLILFSIDAVIITSKFRFFYIGRNRKNSKYHTCYSNLLHRIFSLFLQVNVKIKLLQLS